MGACESNGAREMTHRMTISRSEWDASGQGSTLIKESERRQRWPSANSIGVNPDPRKRNVDSTIPNRGHARKFKSPDCLVHQTALWKQARTTFFLWFDTLNSHEGYLRAEPGSFATRPFRGS